MIELVPGTKGVIAGNLATIRHRNEREGFTVADFELSDGRRLAVVGTLADVAEGDELLLAGEVVSDPRFGLQFRIDGRVDPSLDADSARVYLGSGLVAHIGKATAAAIVDGLGADALNVILSDPSRLLSFRGMTAARLPAIRASVAATISLAPVIGLLVPFSVSKTACRRILLRYGARAVEQIRANPWRLANEIKGVGFTTADRVALGLGYARDDPHRIEAALVQALRDAAFGGGKDSSEAGHTVLSDERIMARASVLCEQTGTPLNEGLDRLVASELVVRTKDPVGYALPRLAAAEAAVAAKVRLITSFDEPPLEISEAELSAVAAAEGIVFDDSQKRAIRGALVSRLSIITGNPGTGKTTLVRAVLELAEQHGLTVALASTTGKAAKRLAEATHREAFTIHRFLRYHPVEGWRGPLVLPDLLVVDEASMLDASLASRLFAALPPFARVLLVGDADQLPAVGPGNVLADLMACPAIGVFRLREIHRTAAGSAVPRLAGAINAGVRVREVKDAQGVIIDASGLPFDGRTTIFRYQEDAAVINDWICRLFEQYAERLDDIVALAPMQRGAAGTHALNAAIQARINPLVEGEPSLRRDGFDLHAGDRVLQTENDYEIGLFNGDTGRLLAIESDGGLRVRFDGEERILPAGSGEGFTLAYAMTVHKAQGSEFPQVIVPMHRSAYFNLSRRLFYTAVSRASRRCIVIGEPRAINRAVSNAEAIERQTLLRGFLAPRAEVPTTLLTLDDEEDF